MLEIAAGGGAGRRSAKNAAAPIKPTDWNTSQQKQAPVLSLDSF